VQRPVSAVLGNHDFYRGTIAGVRQKVRQLCCALPNLHYLPDAGVVPLTNTTCLIGHDGWGDGRLGDYDGSDVMLNDFGLIGEFGGFWEPKPERLAKLHALGDEAADHFRRVLPDALARFHHVIVLTHVPPFREACWHAGKVSDDNWLPFFTCKAVGDVLAETMRAAPDRRMTVLCGHTHGSGEADILPNLRVLTGGAVYGNPCVQRVIEVE
jgi:3',5'-cyclic-AMP phosphodiesterase